MKVLKGITAGVLCLTLLSAPAVGIPLTEGSNQVEASVQTKAMYPNKKTSAYKEQNSKSSRVMTIPYGVRVDRLAVKSSWSQVRYNGKVGWVASRDLVEIKKTEVLDTKQTVTMYPSRSTKAKAITRIPANKQVTRLVVNKSWSQVRYGNQTGWVASSQLKPRYMKETFALKKFRVKEVAPLQSSYSTGSNIIATLPDFGVVESVERYNNWYKVTFDNKTGWVQAKYLTTFKAETPRESVKRIYGDAYEVWERDYPFTIKTKTDINGYYPEVRFMDTYLILEDANLLGTENSREEYLKAAKLITSQNGGNPDQLADKMWEVYVEYPYDYDVLFGKYTISCRYDFVYVNWSE